jgi:hypothetical protein
VQLQITDGDSQEMSQLDQAMKTVFKSSLRRRCGWHIVEKGWDRNVAGLGRTQGAKHIEAAVKQWIYSLMKEVETEVEYSMCVTQQQLQPTSLYFFLNTIHLQVLLLFCAYSLM